MLDGRLLLRAEVLLMHIHKVKDKITAVIFCQEATPKFRSCGCNYGRGSSMNTGLPTRQITLKADRMSDEAIKDGAYLSVYSARGPCCGIRISLSSHRGMLGGHR
jgi:hypothetical protein